MRNCSDDHLPLKLAAILQWFLFTTIMSSNNRNNLQSMRNRNGLARMEDSFGSMQAPFGTDPFFQSSPFANDPFFSSSPFANDPFFSNSSRGHLSSFEGDSFGGDIFAGHQGFHGMIGNRMGFPGQPSGEQMGSQLDITEKADTFEITAKIPQLDLNSLMVDLSGNTVRISAESVIQNETQSYRSSINLSRSIPVAPGMYLDDKHAQVSYENELVKIVVAKVSQDAPQIEWSSGNKIQELQG